jgi:hypothetical protein
MDKLNRVRDWLSARLAATAKPAAGEVQSEPPKPRRPQLVVRRIVASG